MSADPDLIRSMTPIQSSLHNTRGRVDGVCVPPHASILACIQFVRYCLDVLAHDVKSFGVCIWLCMYLLQTVSCALSCIRTVQSYDEFSIRASDFRPGAALFPACRAVGLSQRVCTLACVSKGTRNACLPVGLERA